MESRLHQIVETAKAAIQTATTGAGLIEISAKFVGRKSELVGILRSVAQITDLEERKRLGKLANQTKFEIDQLIEAKQKQLLGEFQNKQMQRDVTLPGISQTTGHLSPLTLITRELIYSLTKLGFSIAEGPEVELEKYNFDLLNIPENHPARDEWDTFWLNPDPKFRTLLRTHTSPVQVRYMIEHRPPIWIIAPGRTFRYEAEDATHASVFSQLEGLVVDKGITVANMKSIITYYVRNILGAEKSVRFRPSFFPFTEPSFEVDVFFNNKWLELMGCGMVHPQVLRNVKIDPQIYSGFAFGLGIERMAMLKYNIPDIRLFLSGDFRFVNQF